MQYLIGGITGFILCSILAAWLYTYTYTKARNSRMDDIKNQQAAWQDQITTHYLKMEQQWERIANALEWQELYRTEGRMEGVE
jgi:hypothetical protein